MTTRIQPISIKYIDCLQHKGNIAPYYVINNISIRQVLAIVMVMSVNNLGFAKNRWADSFQVWVVGSTQLEYARSVIK